MSKTSCHCFVVVLLLLLQVAVVHAAFVYENHVGTTQWKVEVKVDETGCGGGVETEDVPVTIKHDNTLADVGDFGHGPVRGTFNGNVLTIPGRTIPDGSGESQLYEAKIQFTSDCLGFSGSYRWNYEDSYQECSGTTSLRGTRNDGKECPAQAGVLSQREQIEAARKELDDVSKEREYQEILDKDPQNFWANWDMAELRKKQGKAGESLKYVDAATSNKNILASTRAKLKQEELKRLNLATVPTPFTSPLLRESIGEADRWAGGFQYDVSVPKDAAADKNKWRFLIWTINAPDSGNLVNRAMGLPGDE